jgi:hypothetical protein
VQFEKLDLIEAWSKTDPTERVNFAFPISRETGAKTYTVGYAEIPWMERSRDMRTARTN